MRAIWLGMSVTDWIALAVLLLQGALFGLREFYEQIPQSGFLIFLSMCAAVYWIVRGWIWARDHLLWSLRNRLVAAYVFIAVVPVLLLLAMAGLAAYLLYWQLGAYVIHTEMEDREQRVGVVATAMATSYAAEATLGSKAAALTLPVSPETYIRNAMTELPGLKVETGASEELLQANGASGRNRFRGLVFSDGQLALRAVVARPFATGRIVVSALVPVTPELLETLAPELGPIQFRVLRPGIGNNQAGTSHRDQHSAIYARATDRHDRARHSKGRKSFRQVNKRAGGPGGFGPGPKARRERSGASDRIFHHATFAFESTGSSVRWEIWEALPPRRCSWSARYFW